MYTKTYLQMLLSLSFITDKPAVQPAGYDVPLELSTRALLSRTSPGANMQLTYTWPYWDTVALMVSVICISEKLPVKVREESDPLCKGTTNFSSLVLLLGRYLPPGFPLTHLPLFIYCGLNIALTHFQVLSNLLPCFLLGGVYTFVFIQWEKYMQKTLSFPTFESYWLLSKRVQGMTWGRSPKAKVQVFQGIQHIKAVSWHLGD